MMAKYTQFNDPTYENHFHHFNKKKNQQMKKKSTYLRYICLVKVIPYFLFALK